MKAKNKGGSLKWFMISAILSVLIAVFSAVGMGYYLFGNLLGDSEVIRIPDFVGQRFDNIGSFDKIDIKSEPIFSDDVPAGKVISQSPYGGAKRKIADGEKYTVRLTVSLGKEAKIIPDLKNYKYTDAAAALRTLGARIKIVSVYDDRIERDIVLRTSPEVGESIENGDTVTLFVSRNHVHSPVSVKNFVGMTLEDAAAEMLADGLILGDVAEEYSYVYPKGQVISQSIKPESVVAYGSRVDIAVSLGERKEELHPFRGEYTEDNGELNGID